MNNMPEGALAGLRIIDLTDERAIYGAKLLADLGADVVRLEPPAGDPLRDRGPHFESPDEGANSLWHAFFASNRRFFEVDVESSEGQTQLQQLVQCADLVLTCKGAFGVDQALLDTALKHRPELIVIDTSSFGSSGPWSDYLAPDLIAGALGGAAATTGDVDTPPLKAFGELNFMVSGTYVAIAALSALHSRRRTGNGQRAHVSVHESIASCLEQVFMFYWYAENLGRPEDVVLPRRGATHWSNAYDVMQAKNGSIMVTPAPDADAQLVWLIEEDAHQDLIEPEYMEPENIALRTERTMAVLREWVATKDAQSLFFEAQERHAPYGWVLPIEKVAENPQLEARKWFVPYRLGSAEIKAPGAPYHFSETPWTLNDYASPTRNTAEILTDWTADRPSDGAEKTPARPLEGVRILDFTHVLAGPFGTRVLGDMGADVVKISSADRAIGANDPQHPYYIMWNRNKRALALDMSNPDSRPLCRQLCEVADIVIDNFSVGVLDRWGVGYDRISEANPGVIYVQMSGMGDGGPWSGFVTYAPTVHALSGLTHLTGIEGRENIGIGFSYNDHQAGLHGAVAMLAALEARHRTGRGQRVDISQFEVGVNFAGPSLLDYFANNRAARPTAERLPYDQVAPHACYRCAPIEVEVIAEERWVAIACMDDFQWQALKRVMGSPEWADDAQYDSAAGRVSAADTVDTHISQWTRNQDAYELMALCQQAGVPAGVVQNGVDLAERDPQLAAADFAHRIDDVSPLLGQTWADRLPIHFERTPCDDYQRVRVVGEDSAAVLHDWLNMDENAIQDAEGRGLLR